MLNYSLSFLVLSSASESPYISRPQMTGLQRFSIGNSRFKAFSKSLFTADKISAKFYQSSFKKFINPPIHINSVHVTQKIFNTYQDFNDDTKMNIISCVFSDCKNMEEGHGGAVYYNMSTGKITLTKCGFDNCYAKKSSGAIYIYSKCYSIKSSCIQNSFAERTAMAFTIESDQANNEDPSGKNPRYLTFNTFFNNGPQKLGNEQSMYVLAETMAYIENSNFSQSRLISADGTLGCENLLVLDMQLCNFENNSGPGLLSVFQIETQTEINYCNFIKNDATEKGSLISFIGCTRLFVNRSSFFGNKFGNFISSDDTDKVVFFECFLDLSKKDIRRNASVVFFKGCQFRMDKSVSVQISAVELDQCFQMLRTQTFSPSMTFMPTQSPPPPTKSLTPSSVFTATRNWTPKTLCIQKYILLLAIVVSLPAMFILARMTGKGTKRKRNFN